ncbi:AAA family ATPase [Lentzea sp. NPDC051213]|uniref:AAA family ATPase n=1 Tax=Lentzea sp. NPDC051213 TaxID=3364126 RepID=UPI0037B62210
MATLALGTSSESAPPGERSRVLWGDEGRSRRVHTRWGKYFAMNLVEREDLLGELENAFTRSLMSDGRTVLISGPPGTGKTALLRTAGAMVGMSDTLLLRATASRGEQNVAFGVLSQLFTGIELCGERTQLLHQLLEIGALSAEMSDAPQSAPVPRQVLHGVLAMVRHLAGCSPVVIEIDDVNHADPASLCFLLYLARRLSSLRVLLLLTESAEVLPAYTGFRAEIAETADVLHLVTRTLSPAGVAELAGERTSRHASAADDMVRLTGGNPLLLNALLHDRSAGDQVRAGDGFRHAVLSCVARCGPVATRVSRALAVAGEAVSADALAGLLDLPAAGTTAALGTLTDAGLVCDGRLRHDEVRSAVIDGMPTDERKSLHVAVARQLDTTNASASTVARHLLEGESTAVPHAAAQLQEAAGQALRDNDLKLAIRFLQLALRAEPDDERRTTIISTLAMAKWQVDPGSVHQYLPHLVDSVRAGRIKGQEALDAIGYLLWHGRLDEAAAALTALGHDDELDTTRWLLSCTYPELAGVEDADRSIERIEQVLETVAQRDSASPVAIAALAALIYADRLDCAARWCDRLLRQAQDHKRPTMHALFAAAKAVISVRRGDPVAAQRRAHAALALVPPKSWGVTVGVPLAAMVQAATAMGRLEEAATYLAVPVPASMFRTTYGLHYLCARGQYHLATGAAAEALADFRRCGELTAAWRLDATVIVPWRIGIAQAHLGLGDHAAADRVLRAEVEHPRPRPGSPRDRGVALRLLAARATGRRRLDLLRESVRVLQGCGDRVDLAHTLAALSKAHHESGDLREAQLLAHRAHRQAQLCGVEPVLLELPAELVPAEPARRRMDVATTNGTGRGTAPLDCLTDAEQRVALLVREGHTNRKIATKLYLTVSTVEQHLTRIYRKLDVRSRRDLAEVIGEQPKVPAL